ncbi:MAG: cryptochrome/DNA photolyase family protein [Planctomycetota bacterium]
MGSVPTTRLRDVNDGPVDDRGRYVLYWMRAARRMRGNFGLDRAIEHAQELRRPLLVFEPLRADYEHASDRLHVFAIQGMAAHARETDAAGVRYFPYVEPRIGAGRGLLRALARHACVVVTDDHPCFHFPAMLEAAAHQVPVRLEAVDGNGLLPMGQTDRAFPTAYAFRRQLQRTLGPHLGDVPSATPLARRRLPGRASVPREVLARWAPTPRSRLEDPLPLAASLPIDHGVGPAPMEGGGKAGRAALRLFVRRRLAQYAEARQHPDLELASGLSPYLHWGHVGAHEVFRAVVDAEDWDASRIAEGASGSRRGWWGASENAEAFLDQLITWRELGFNFCRHEPAYADYDTLPPWALKTLGEHLDDPRSHLYDLGRLEAADTHDEVWNAAQRQLVREGRLQNYLRMLWGKNILAWSPSPQEALSVMIHLNDKYAVDGRDPNSYAGICWVLGRYDRPWGPERPVFGKVRYMTSANTKRKLQMSAYLEKYA